MDVAVMGAGSLGSLVGGLLAQRHDVTLVGREPHMRAVAVDGLQITGEVQRTAHPAVVTSWDGVGNPDVGIVTVKSYDTRSAGEEMRTAPPPTVVSLQNGLGNGEVLDELLGDRSEVLVGTVTYGALLTDPGTVRCTGRGRVEIGTREGTRSSTAERLVRAWSRASLECRLSEDMPRRLWEKVVINAAINPVTALAQVRNGRILEDPLRPIAIAAAREAVRVASQEGFELEMDAMLSEVESVARQTRENESSMARDVRMGSQTEIEAITGEIIARADRDSVPVNHVLYGLLVGYEIGEGLRNGG